jgi:RNA polymerase sigma-70 factor (ECF subfamily)
MYGAMSQSLAWSIPGTWQAQANRARRARAADPVVEDGEKARSVAGGAPADATLADLDEASLVEACLAGRLDAFDVIVERHRRAVYQLCYRFVANHEDASDLSQDVFLRAYRGLRGFRGSASLATWLYRIGVNVCLNRVSAKTPPTESIDERQHVDRRTESASERLLRDERAARVRAAIAQLPRKQRATLILRIYQEMPHQQIAEVLGSSVGAVKANFFHALSNLKKLLGDEML